MVSVHAAEHPGKLFVLESASSHVFFLAWCHFGSTVSQLYHFAHLIQIDTLVSAASHLIVPTCCAWKPAWSALSPDEALLLSAAPRPETSAFHDDVASLEAIFYCAESNKLYPSFCELPSEEDTRPKSASHHPHCLCSLPCQFPRQGQVFTQVPAHDFLAGHG